MDPLITIYVLVPYCTCTVFGINARNKGESRSASRRVNTERGNAGGMTEDSITWGSREVGASRSSRSASEKPEISAYDVMRGNYALLERETTCGLIPEGMTMDNDCISTGSVWYNYLSIKLPNIAFGDRFIHSERTKYIFNYLLNNISNCTK